MRRRVLLQLLGLATTSRLLPAKQHGQLSLPDAPAAGSRPLFFFNQLGYLPAAEKVATICGVDSSDIGFRLCSAGDGRIVFRGSLSDVKHNDASGDTVRLADFSVHAQPGRYRLEINGHRSESFVVGGGVYEEALRLAVRAYYGQRCGCHVDLGHGYEHPACHAKGEFHPSSGKAGAVSNAGGWHDAGDYGRYVVNSGLTCGTLLWAWEMHREVLAAVPLAIPKAQAHLPGYLEEILWNLNWMLSMQDADGGVFHKQTSEHFCSFVMPQKDDLSSEIIGTGSEPYKSTCATADFAAVMAIAARCYGEFDKALAAKMLGASIFAWEWAMKHPDVTFRNPPGVTTGEYGDHDCGDEILWASAELWRTMGERRFEEGFLAGLPPGGIKVNIQAPSWPMMAPMAFWAYVMTPGRGDENVKEAVRTATAKAANTLVIRGRQSGYGNTLALEQYRWGSNSTAANQSMLLALAHRFEPKQETAEAALGNLHYLLGRNCHGVSWVTQVGTRPFEHPHHRPSVADGLRKPWPGLLSGGPNARPADPVAEALRRQAPMRMWTDDQGAYSMNEVAINWNAPLVFLLAFANQLQVPAGDNRSWESGSSWSNICYKFGADW